MTFSEETELEIIKIPEILTADLINDLRVQLIELIKNNNYKIRFDFSGVQHINSKALQVFAVFLCTGLHSSDGQGIL